MSTQIKVGFCVAYDWYLLKYALPLVYNHADTICLSIDTNRISWANNQYDFDESAFADLIKSVDKENKIILFEDDFHLFQLSPMENEVRQRNMMAQKMGSGGWHVQLDCDEYFIDFDKFTIYLKDTAPHTVGSVNICCKWVTLFKKVDEGFFYITPLKKKYIEFIQVATNYPIYEYGRRNGVFNIYTNFHMIHQSWARSEHEISNKLDNWGHKNDFDAGSYIKLWKSLSVNNYKTFYNFHPTQPDAWSGLSYVEGKTIENFVQEFNPKAFSLTYFELRFKNSRILAKIKSLLKSIG